MSKVLTPSDQGYSGCNGVAEEEVKVSPDSFEELPNGLHSKTSGKCILKETEMSRDEEKNEEVEDCAEATENAVKRPNCASKNELIDKFSTELTMSLINSVQSEGFGSHKNYGNFMNMTDLTSQGSSGKVKNVAVDSTVVFPISETPVQSEYIVGVKDGIQYLRYENETQMSAIMQLITKDLSEPYSIYTYRYFIHNWPHLCFLATHDENYVGAIVCKLDVHKKISRRGYIAMLAIDKSVRRKRIGTTLVKLAIETMHKEGCDEVVLETEVTNKPALKLYENLGFVRDKRLFRYYLNGVDALRLKLWLR